MTVEERIEEAAEVLAKQDGWLSLRHPSPQTQAKLRERVAKMLAAQGEIEEQAAMYLRTYGLDREAVQDEMSLNLLRPVDEEYNLKRAAYKESGAIFRGTADHMMLEEWARLDVDLVEAFYGLAGERSRLAAQRPLIHNGRKMRKNGN